MDSLAVFFAVLQALGALCGAFLAVWGELAYVRAFRDGTIDDAERAHLRAIGRGLRLGMGAILIASIGLVVLAYLRHAPLQPALTANYWIAITLGLLIIAITWALSRRRVRFALGSATVFTAWWFLAYLMLGDMPRLTFGAALALYIVATAILYVLLHYLRALLTPEPSKNVL